MSENPTSPLSGGEEAEQWANSRRPKSHHSAASTRSNHSRASIHSDESTPLIARTPKDRDYGNAPRIGASSSPDATSLRSLQDEEEHSSKQKRRWPTIVALTILSVVIIAILGLGFAAPAAVEEYSKQALVFEPTDLSIDSLTATGVKARIRGDFTLDASRVKKKPVRDIGRAGTWIAKAVESKPSKVRVYLPEYENVLLGTASVPPIVVDIRNGHITHVDILTDLESGDVPGIRRIANDWIDGKLGQLRVEGKAKVGLKSGIFSLGTQSISETLLFKGQLTPFVQSFQYFTCEKTNLFT